jgi:hypothetical protein
MFIEGNAGEFSAAASVDGQAKPTDRQPVSADAEATGADLPTEGHGLDTLFSVPDGLAGEET